MVQENYFDFYDILFNQIIGDVWLGLIVGLLVWTILGIKAKMPMPIIFIFDALWLIIVSVETEIWVIYVYTIFFLGVLFYYMISSFIGRR